MYLNSDVIAEHFCNDAHDTQNGGESSLVTPPGDFCPGVAVNDTFTTFLYLQSVMRIRRGVLRLAIFVQGDAQTAATLYMRVWQETDGEWMSYDDIIYHVDGATNPSPGQWHVVYIDREFSELYQVNM